MLADANVKMLLFGHTNKTNHRMFAYEHEGKTCYHLALNIGSVAKTKDGDPCAAYQLLHLNENTSLTDPISLRSELICVADFAGAEGRFGTRSSRRPTQELVMYFLR